MTTIQNTDKPALGHLIRMRALKTTELPAHPKLASLQTKGRPPPLKQFLEAVLDEGHDFMTAYLPKTFKVKEASKPSPPSTAHVQVLQHEISAHDLPEEGRTMGAPEHWFARTSIHENAAKAGTASFDEFDGGLRRDHSKHEADYTPSVLDAHRVLDWAAELGDGSVGPWRDVDAALMEMVHKIPFPLQNRVFAVLVVSARKEREFEVVQVPVELARVEGVRHVTDAKLTAGMYCSIERGEVVGGGGQVRWDMGTASDAKGALPMWAQKMGVPGAVVKDVGWFLDWCEQQRR